MHIAATNPLTISPDEISHELLEKEREIWKAQLLNEGKKEALLDNIMLGKEKKFREESSLLKQPFVKNPEITIEGLISDAAIKIGENIKVVRFSRFSM
jgi:elongation factor Ts